jgi:glutaredoxin 3
MQRFESARRLQVLADLRNGTRRLRVTRPHVVVYTKVPCPFCTNAKALLHSKRVVFEEIDVTDNPSLRDEVIQRSGMRTVPQVFIDGESIGGFDNLKALNESGELDCILGIA